MDHSSATGVRVLPGVETFVTLISILSARLAGATGDEVAPAVDECLRELLAFFGMEQCGIMEIQPNVRQARLRHVVYVDGITPAPGTIEYGKFFPFVHEMTVLRGEMLVQRCIEDLPGDALPDRASAKAMGFECLVAIPAGIGGRVTHVLCLTHREAKMEWPAPVLAWLKTIAETVLAVLTRHNAEQALHNSERNLREAQRIAGVGSFVRDWFDDTLMGSDEANRIFGHTLGEITPNVLDLVHADDRSRVEEAMRASLSRHERMCEIEYRIIRPDGAVLAIRSSTETIYAADGAPLRTVATIQDISQLRAAEQEARRLRAELRHSDRAAHLGALTASLSHELNQPLTGILANAQAGLQRLGAPSFDSAEIRELLNAIVSDDKRAAAVVTNLRRLLRREELPRMRFDVAEALREVLTLFRGELEAGGTRLECRMETGCIVFAERTQIQQVMVNLLANALHALEPRPMHQRTLVVTLSRNELKHAEISVCDNGCGVPTDRLERIFEPFFTTRTDGLGMGLAISRSIVEAHGGSIDAANNPNANGGATFRFSVPEDTTDAGTFLQEIAQAAAEGVAGATDGSACICIVDDDDASRGGLARLINAAGWSVIAFDSPSAALESAAIRSAQCLLLDVQMPGMSGLELHAELGRRAIMAPAIFITARDDAATGVEAMKRGAIEYLIKPVDQGVLLEAIRKGLRHHGERTRLAQEREMAGQRIARLTPRECDVLRYVIRGRLNKQIADVLSISEATVKQHRGQVMEKMEVRSVAELVRLCEGSGFAAEV